MYVNAFFVKLFVQHSEFNSCWWMGLYKHYLLLLLYKHILLSRTDYRKHSYIPETTADWNNLPQEVPSNFYNNNNEHLERLTRTGLKRLHVLGK